MMSKLKLDNFNNPLDSQKTVSLEKAHDGHKGNLNTGYFWVIVAAIIWLKYCWYGKKKPNHQLINQTIFNSRQFSLIAKYLFWIERWYPTLHKDLHLIVPFVNVQAIYVTCWNTFYMFICGEFFPLENFSLAWRGHHCQWRAANFDYTCH